MTERGERICAALYCKRRNLYIRFLFCYLIPFARIIERRIAPRGKDSAISAQQWRPGGIWLYSSRRSRMRGVASVAQSRGATKISELRRGASAEPLAKTMFVQSVHTQTRICASGQKNDSPRTKPAPLSRQRIWIAARPFIFFDHATATRVTSDSNESTGCCCCCCNPACIIAKQHRFQ